ncbi:MAG: putative bifunctional diguanylate cyclase/phosphodiesterase, partial [Clostridium sp.]
KGLRSALDKNEINLVFQAKVDTITEEVIGYECLCRWNSEKLGLVSPVEFIPIAERTGLIIKIGKYIINYAVKMCKQLSLATDKKFKIAINISDVQIRDESIVEYIADTLKKFNLCPSYIEFEITESLIMKSVEQNIECLKRLKEIGVSIALDDFGTGYSSLSYLKILPIDVLKIDKTFIDGINIDKKSEYIIERIVDLSHHLDIKVVAEGVESKEQVDYLRAIECDVIQGYYYSKPKQFEEAKRLIDNKCLLFI